MPRNRKLELNYDGINRWVTTDGRFGILRIPQGTEPWKITYAFKIKYVYSIRDLRGWSMYREYMQIAPEIGRVESFKEVFPWLGRHTGEGSFDTEDIERTKPRGMAEDIDKIKFTG